MTREDFNWKYKEIVQEAKKNPDLDLESFAEDISNFVCAYIKSTVVAIMT